MDSDIFNYFQVIRNEESRNKLIEMLHLTPYSRDEFNLAYEPTTEPIEKARRLIVRAQMGFGTAGAVRKTKNGFRTCTTRAPNTPIHVWSKFLDSLILFGERFQDVLVENRPAIQVMQSHDLPDTLHYVDPPYLHSTRDYHTTQNGSYSHEMTDNEHLELLNVLLQLKGSIVLSGYDNELYNDILTGWKKETKDHYASGQKGGTKRTEILWIKSNAQQGLFIEEQLCNS